jgi:hypothetical protein
MVLASFSNTEWCMDLGDRDPSLIELIESRAYSGKQIIRFAMKAQVDDSFSRPEGRVVASRLEDIVFEIFVDRIHRELDLKFLDFW